MQNRTRNIIEPVPAQDPAIGRWLWALEDARMRTMEVLEGLDSETAERQPPDGADSIGSILYHIAAIEVDWLYEEVLVAPFPEEVDRLFPYPIREEEGRLARITGASLEDHIDRLKAVRRMLLGAYRGMDLDDFRRVRSLPHYDVTPEWVLHHLMQHEAEHRSSIDALKRSQGNR